MSIVLRETSPVFVWNTAQTVSVTLEQDGQVLTPSAGTIQILNAAGTAIYLNPPTNSVTSANCTTLGGGATSATYDIVADVFTSVDPTTRYKVVWTLTIASKTEKIEQELFVTRIPFYPPITDDDLARRLSALHDDYELPPGKTSWQSYIDEAWSQLISRLLAEQITPHEITSWYAFREVLCRMTEATIARDLSLTRSGATKWGELYAGLMATDEDPRSIEWAWAHKGYRLDRDADAIPDADSAAESRPGGFWNNNASGGWRGF